MLTLKLKTNNEVLKELYGKRRHNNGSVDLYISENVTIPPYVLGYQVPLSIEIVLLDEYGNNLPYFIMPRFNIHKTPLRLSQSLGLVDSRFQREPALYIDNLSDESFCLYQGDLYFQLIHPSVNGIDVKTVDNLNYSPKMNPPTNWENLSESERNRYIIVPFASRL